MHVPLIPLLPAVAAACALAAGSATADDANAAARPGARPASFADFDRRARAGKPMNVVFFGGSLTWGANASDPQRTSYRARMGRWLREAYPRCPFAFHDAAIGGTGSKLGLFRLRRDVLAHRPDLVFLDFTANDGLEGTDQPTLAAYECLVRELVARGTPVVQVLLGFKWNFAPRFRPDTMPRRRDHLKIAAAYGLGVADSFPHIQQALDANRTTLKVMWPLDGVHPGDRGYELFFEAARDGFRRAVAEKRTCRMPAEPVFPPALRGRRRLRLVATDLPDGWTRKLTYRTSLWFDGLSSRWMDDVAVFDAAGRERTSPLTFEFTGTLVGLFGEADENGLDVEVRIDGKRVPYRPNPKKPARDTWAWNTSRFGKGRLFIWRVLASDLAPGKHTLELRPVLPAESGKGQLRVESLCTAGP